MAFKKQTKNTRNKWICSACKYNWENTNIINSKSSELSLQDLADSVNFMGQKFDEFNVTVNKILEEMKEIRKDNVKLNDINKKLNQELHELKYRIDDTEENNFKSTIEIVGIPTVANEKCIDSH